MTFTATLAGAALALSAAPAALFLWNRRFYQLPPAGPATASAVPLSVLIPARNEAENIEAAVRSVLANRGVPLEVVVLDDLSTDDTAARVARLAREDSRVRLVKGQPLPAGWKGKVHACQQLSGHARHEWMLFLDADVRVEAGGLARLMAARERSGAAFLSGVPRQVTVTWLERWLLPLIHVVLLGFLPMWWMRRGRSPAFAAGCGQLYLVHRAAYLAAGGHAAVRGSLHDGLQLARAFRRAGQSTDLFDATPVASCRMYHDAASTWDGLGRNATEGLGSPGAIVPMTLLLLGGQVLPFALLGLVPWMAPMERGMVLAAVVLAWLPRWWGIRWFRQPAGAALLHPVAVLLLLVIQWQALIRQFFGRPACWRGRVYGTSTRSVDEVDGVPSLIAGRHLGLLLCGALAASFSAAQAIAAPAERPAGGAVAETNAIRRCVGFLLQDQHDGTRAFEFPRRLVTVIVVADRSGSDQTTAWTEPLARRFRERADIVGVADLAAVPAWLRNRVKRGFQEKYEHPVLLDWSGAVTRSLGATRNQANVLLVDRAGVIVHRLAGPATPDRLAGLAERIETTIDGTENPASRP